MPGELLIALIVVAIGGLLIYVLRSSSAALRYRDASETEGSWIDRKAAYYLRALSLREVVWIIVGGCVLLFIGVEFDVWLF